MMRLSYEHISDRDREYRRLHKLGLKSKMRMRMMYCIDIECSTDDDLNHPPCKVCDVKTKTCNVLSKIQNGTNHSHKPNKKKEIKNVEGTD